MRVNNKTFEQFGMKVYSFSYQPLSMSAITFQNDRGLNIVHGGFEVTLKQMNMICLFRDKLNISRFIQNVSENVPTIIDIEDGFRYECYYQGGSNQVSEIYNGWYKVSFPFLVIQQSRTVRKIELKSVRNTILNSGTYKCPCIIEITPGVDIANITIGNYTIKDLKANKKFTIDGVTKKVYDQNGNRFSDVKFKNNTFPFLDTGINIINITSIQNVKVVIKYREVFI